MTDDWIHGLVDGWGELDNRLDYRINVVLGIIYVGVQTLVCFD
jgi:hypothetical protein